MEMDGLPTWRVVSELMKREGGEEPLWFLSPITGNWEQTEVGWRAEGA